MNHKQAVGLIKSKDVCPIFVKLMIIKIWVNCQICVCCILFHVHVWLLARLSLC